MANGSPDRSVGASSKKKGDDSMGTSKLNSLLIDKGIEGAVMRKVMDATVNITLKRTKSSKKFSK